VYFHLFSLLIVHGVTVEHSLYGIRRVVARNEILEQLLVVKREHEKDAEHKVHIYMADT